MSVLQGSTMRYGLVMPEIFPAGVFIQSIEQTKSSDESGGENIITVTLTDHTQRYFKIRNGYTGSACAGIKEVRASVGDSVGAPSVEVVETDAGNQKIINFAFNGLKGEKGERGEKGEKGDTTIAEVNHPVLDQIKQDSKEYIATELAVQKEALEKEIKKVEIALEAKKRELTDLIAAMEKELSRSITDFNQGVQTALSSLSTIGEVRFFSHAGYTPGFLYANGSSFIPELYPAYYALWQKLHNNPKSTAYCGYDRFGYPKTPDLRKNAPSPLYPFIKV